MRNSATLVSVLAIAGSVAAQGYITDFETFAASPLGTPMSGQDGFYIPAVTGSIDGTMLTYAGNPHLVPVNPFGGGNNFWAGVSQGGTAFARSQRALTLPTGKIRIEYDVCCTYTGTVLPTNNIGSFSFQPSTNAIYVNLLAAWPTTVTLPPTTWDANVVTRGVPPATVTTVLPDPAFQNLPVGVWHHWGVTVDLIAGTHDEFTITNGVTFVTTHYVPATPLLLPIAPGVPAPLPTDFRLFGGGGLGNVFAVDNLQITYGAEYEAFGTGCPGALGVPTLAAAPGSLPRLGTTFSATIGNLPVGVGLMITGFSNTLAGGAIPLPLPLGSVGFPGCDLLVDPVVTDTVVGAGTSANWNLTIPPLSVFLNFQFYNQGASLDTGPTFLTFANGARARVGL